MITKPAVLIVFAVLVGACAPKAQVREFELDKLVKVIEKRAYIVKRFRATFTKRRHSSLFKRVLQVDGSLVFVKPNRFWMTTKGDVNVEVISDGKTIALTHDGRDRETYRLQGDRDMSRFADPLLLLVNRIGNGGFRKFAVDVISQDVQCTELEVSPGSLTHFERMEKALLSFGTSGMLEKVRIVYKNGNWDETIFRSWALLTPKDPQVRLLEKKLDTLGSEIASPHPRRIESSLDLLTIQGPDNKLKTHLPCLSPSYSKVSSHDKAKTGLVIPRSVLTTTP